MQQNLQILRTDKAIKQALIHLLKIKPFEKITVQDILDETPVTRSTFYKHFHDKYEIIERMQDEYFASRLELQAAAHASPHRFSLSTLTQRKQNNELLDALLKVHTEHVDIRKALSHESAIYYLKDCSRTTAEIEAEIFSQAMTAFQLSFPTIDEFSFEYMHEIYINVFLKILGISEDEELKNLLLSKAASTLNS